MRLIKATTAKEIEAAIRAPRGDRPLVEITTVDKTVKGVRIGTAHFAQESYSSFTAMVEQPFDVAKRHRLTATMKGFPPAISFHDSEYDARAAQGVLDAAVTSEIDEIDVLINDDGEVVGEANVDASPAKPVSIDDVSF